MATGGLYASSHPVNPLDFTIIQAGMEDTTKPTNIVTSATMADHLGELVDTTRSGFSPVGSVEYLRRRIETSKSTKAATHENIEDSTVMPIAALKYLVLKSFVLCEGRLEAHVKIPVNSVGSTSANKNNIKAQEMMDSEPRIALCNGQVCSNQLQKRTGT